MSLCLNNSARFLCRVYIWLSPCVIYFQVTFLDEVAHCIEWKWGYSWAHVTVLTMVVDCFLMRCKVTHTQQWVLTWALRTSISIESPYLFTILCTIVAEIPKHFSKRVNVFFWLCQVKVVSYKAIIFRNLRILENYRIRFYCNLEHFPVFLQLRIASMIGKVSSNNHLPSVMTS